MQRAALFTTLLTLLLASGAAFAQTNIAGKSHGVNVNIPEMTFIRMTLGNSNADVGSPDDVLFQWSMADFNTVQAGTFGPTNATAFNWDDVQVRYNGGNATAWQVQVSTTGSGGFDWSKVAMLPVVADPYDLSATATIESGTGNTAGWHSLGIDPSNYEITLDGTEDQGTYSATVTFTLQNP